MKHKLLLSGQEMAILALFLTHKLVVTGGSVQYVSVPYRYRMVVLWQW